MKKLFISLSLFTILFSGCLKDTPVNDFSKLSPVVELFYYDASGTAHGGIDNFSKDAVIASGTGIITIEFSVNLASVQPLDKDVTVMLGVDDAARSSYNSSHPTGIQYEAMPASAFGFTKNTGIIKAGVNRVKFTITFDPTQIDPTKSLMAPITIKDAQGILISGNFPTIYFHTIGNPLAGNYTISGKRYNYTGSVAWNGVLPVPANFVNTAAFPATKLASPVDPKIIAIDFANLGANGYQYLISYDPATPNNVSVNFNSTFLNADSHIDIPIHTYDPATKTIHIVTHYNNAADGSGNDRIIDETFVHL